MRSLLLTAAAPGLVAASPWGPSGKPTYTWRGNPHPGWPKPSVYTPPVPAPHWPYQTTTQPSATSSPVSTSGYATGSVTSSASFSTYSSTAATNSSSSSARPNACASVSKLASSYTQSAGASATPTVPAALAWECITSVPFNSSAAVELMDSIRPYIQWQTTITYLKDPPAVYAEKVQGPYDFWAIYDSIYEKAKAGNYPNERAFGWDLYEVFQRAHDGHFVYYPDSVNLIFSFGRTTPLVSVSLDGKSVPEVYVYTDVLAASFGNSTFTPSPLRQIDGQNSTEWLLNFSEYGSLQDRDALWNNMFYLLAQVSLGPTGTGAGTFAGGGRGQWVYPGPHTTLTFANGTSVINENFARVLVPFDGIKNGEDIYKTYFTPPSNVPDDPEQLISISSAAVSSSSSSALASSSTSSSSTTTIPAPGYPSPIIREPNNLNSGYFLEGEGYDDIAVLSVPSFVGSTADEIDFQIVNTFVINLAKAMGKKKLIIDVSANGGGTILQGYDLFKQLFPSILPYGATRFRAHEAFNLIGEEVSYYSGLVPRSLKDNLTTQNIISTPWNYRSDDNKYYEPFHSWPQKYGPHEHGPGPDNFTSLIRWNLSDVLTPDNSGGIYVSGYLKRANITVQPFAAEDIVIVYDGYCASTCTIFSELMRQQGHVKTIALGGRPNKDIIQAVGGVKGTNDFPYPYILYGVELPFKIQHYHDDAYYNNTVLGDYNDLPLYRGVNYVVNARDGIRKGDESQTPLQFVYEPADCRIFYTPAMAVDQVAAWKTVADTAFRGINHCVAGSYNGTASQRRLLARDDSPTRPHAVRRDVNIADHYAATAKAWERQGSIAKSGDGFMPL